MPQDFDNYNNDPTIYDDDSFCYACPYYYRQAPPKGFYPPPQSPPPHMNTPKGGPPGPPPTAAPNKNEAPVVKSVSPGSIKPCVFRYVYIWLDNGTSFWAWLTRVDMRTASGFRWQQRRWMYFGVDLRRIESFECY